MGIISAPARAGRVVFLAALTLVLASCTQSDLRRFATGRWGPNPAIQAVDFGNVAQNQTLVLVYLASQLGLVTTDANGAPVLLPLNQADLYNIAQVGFNVGRQDCEIYLNTLFRLNREKQRYDSILSAAAASTAAILTATNASAKALSIVAAAFGLTTAATDAVLQSYLFSEAPGLVANKVRDLQDAYQKQLDPRSITTPALAYAAIQRYYNICLPESIEGALVETIASSSAIVPAPGNVLTSPKLVQKTSPNISTAGVPFKPASPVQAPIRAALVPNPYEQFFREQLSKQEAEFALRGLCFDKNNEAGITTSNLIKALVGIYEDYRRAENRPVAPETKGVITRTERQEIEAQPDCGPAKNFYEKVTFANTLSAAARANSADAISAFADLLSRSPADGAIGPNPSLTSLREKIRAVRAALQLSDVPSAMSDQVTPALIDALKKLPPKAN